MWYFDLINILHWWILLFIIGIIFLPFSKRLLPSFIDKGYIFSKIIGSAIVSYVIFILGTLHLATFSQIEIVSMLCIFIFIFLYISVKSGSFSVPPKKMHLKSVFSNWKIFVIEECLFLIGLIAWSYVRGYQPDIHGLEKYMDFGFLNSILRSTYFPPTDIWFTPYSINYYYFGHFITAVLTKLSGISSTITFNLMLATLFSFTFMGSFSIGITLYSHIGKKLGWIRLIAGGIITSFLVTLGGNLHTIYTFFKPYQNDYPVPFWQLKFSPFTFPNAYWYPNATRFIYHTIHEFPIYSFVVSDLHGHVLDIPFVLLTVAILLSLFFKKLPSVNKEESFATIKLIFSNWAFELTTLCFLFAIMYMTNAWDAFIYFLLTLIILSLIFSRNLKDIKKGIDQMYILILIIIILICGGIVFALPFSLFFKPFVSGIGVICAPNFLIQKGKIGPFLFEANHCERSPLWQLFILYGFFYFWVLSFIVFLKKTKKIIDIDYFVIALILLSTILIIIPEFFYVKDIYPTYYRANTMFKFVYQAFMMLSISSAYILIRIVTYIKANRIKKLHIGFLLVWAFFALIGLSLVAIYPYFAITSYYPIPKQYVGLNGTTYLKNLYPTDYQAINWINAHISGNPVILEAQGDSYTDYARISSNTGLPTILGWTVHEWLWRGTYDIPAPRITEVKTMYETSSLSQARALLEKYHVKYVFVGDLEREKYPNLQDGKFSVLGKPVFRSGQTTIYKLL